jgi:hypothetical protein
MPFQLSISDVEYGKDEVTVTGKLISGAYAGPELITVTGQNGRAANFVITHHGMSKPEGWPVLPEHRSTLLRLSFRIPDPHFRVDDSQPVIGRGVVFQNANRIDITAELRDPMFWATWLGFHVTCDEVEEPHEYFWGVSQEAVNDYYRRTFEDYFQSGRSPYLSLQLDDSRYLELESSASVEYQDRFWIGDRATGKRALLGYHSGHFSLPAFRTEEANALASALISRAALKPAGLLPMTGCYRGEGDAWPSDLIKRLAAEVPGIRPGTTTALEAALSQRAFVPSIRWERDAISGWINNSPYSQRNPNSTMSVLTADDFRFIERFFAENPAGR